MTTLKNFNFFGSLLFTVDALTRTRFKIFLRKVFETICPGEVFQDNWHIDYIISLLQNVENSDLTRLAINLPPRSLKSIIISVAWPAWLMGHDPSKKAIVVSYSQALANKHSQDCRMIMQSDWYARIFSRTKLKKGDITKGKFLTTKNGFRLATSIESTLTGEGADVIIIDDPMTPLQAASQTEREKVNFWFDTTLSSRLNNKKLGAMVLTMQRLHTNDLTGHLISKGNWRLEKLAAVAQIDETYKLENATFTRYAGDLLHPSRENLQCIEQAKLELGAAAFNAQYQQNPVSSVYSVIKPQWAQRYEKAPQCGSSLIYQSWDCAAKTHELNDYSVCTTWQVSESGDKIYLLDVLREKMDYPQLKAAALAQCSKYGASAVLIEDRMTGHALIQDLKKGSKLSVIPIVPKNDKLTRTVCISSFFEAGRVHLPMHATFLADYENEIFNFPNCHFDDQVDSTSQFLNWLKTRNTATPRIRLL